MQRLLTNSIHRASKGFTVVELIVVITVSGLLMTVLFGPLNDLYQDNTRGVKSVIQVADTRGALRFIQHNVSLGYSFLNTNQITDPTGTSWTWTGSGTTSRVLITRNYATTIDEAVDTSGTRALLYGSGACSATPLFNNIIYFVNNGTLYRRTIKNTTSTCAGAVGQKQTCTAGYTNPACQATDAKILSNVTNFTVDYYDTASSTTPITNQYSDTSAPGAAKTVVITVTARSGTGAIDTTTTSSLRITRLNGS
jgi:prepilin-type N-terminal cleavage/methylation domain-containing protein